MFLTIPDKSTIFVCAGFSYFHYLLTCWVSPLLSREEILEMQFVQAKLKFMSCLFAQNMVGKPLSLIYFPQDNNPFLLEPEKHYEYEPFPQENMSEPQNN